MPEIMNVTNPVPGYDNAASNRSIPITTNDPNVQNIPDPSRVTRPDANTGEHHLLHVGETETVVVEIFAKSSIERCHWVNGSDAYGRENFAVFYSNNFCGAYAHVYSN